MSHFRARNAVRLLQSGAMFFPALQEAIEQARDEIHLETYILRVDSTTQPLLAALMRASARGVEVNMVIDGFGSRDFPQAWIETLEAAGVHLLIYRPEVMSWLPRRNRLRRLHRKLVVIDGHTAFVGGINLHDDSDNAESGYAPRYDYAVVVQGPVLHPIHFAVKTLWQRLCWARGLRAGAYRVRANTQPAGELDALFLVRDNLLRRQSIEQEYLRQIESAQSEIVIANAYFLPGLRLRSAILRAAARGIQVSLLLQGRADHPIMFYATHVLYRLFLSHGVRIFEYHAGYMHAKVAVVDQLWATVGSSNIDPFSLQLAREANLVVRNADFAADLRTRIFDRIAHASHEIKLADIAQAGVLKRLGVWVCYGFARFAINLAGLGAIYSRE